MNLCPHCGGVVSESIEVDEDLARKAEQHGLVESKYELTEKGKEALMAWFEAQK